MVGAETISAPSSYFMTMPYATAPPPRGRLRMKSDSSLGSWGALNTW